MDTPPRPRNFFRYLAIGMCHFHRLWNGMCDRHRAKITVMQFTGHSLQVLHFVTAQWDLHLVPYCQQSSPTRSLPIIGHWNVSHMPSLEWHVWSSSSGNNCHAIHRSLSSGASLYDGTVGFFTLSHIVSQAVFYMWRCPWCNGYHYRKWTRRHEFKSWTRLIVFHIALIPLGKVWIQLFSLQLWVNSRVD